MPLFQYRSRRIFNMSVQVEKLEHNMAKLTITVPAETFDKAITQAYKKMKNQISVPGFRKGKVPQAMVEKMYGAGMFYEDAANIVIPEAYDAALAEVKDIVITSQPEIDVVQIAKGQEFIFTAEVAVKPEVKLGDYKGIEVPETVIEVTDEEIEAELKKTQEQNAREISVDRPAENGDTVVIDYEGSVDGELFEGGSAQDHPLVLGSNSFIPGFEDQLVGAVADSDVDVNVTFPEEYHAPDLAGKAALFKVKVHEVKTKELPEINDEFAQDVSEFDTLEEYKADVKKSIADTKAEAALQEKQQKVMDKIIENAEMDIPEPMIMTQTRQMADRFAQQMQYNGLTMEQYFQFTGLTQEKLLDSLKPQALKNIQSRLVLEAIAAAEKVEVSQEEIDEEFGKMAAQYNMEVEKLKEIFGDTETEAIRDDLAAQKALDLVTEAAVEVPATAVEATVEDAE
jgi:trigger factor